LPLPVDAMLIFRRGGRVAAHGAGAAGEAADHRFLGIGARLRMRPRSRSHYRTRGLAPCILPRQPPMLLARASKVIDKAAVSRAYHAGVRKAWNIAMKRLTAFCAIAVLLLGEAAAEGRTDRIDLNRLTCKQFLQMNRDDALIVVGWLQGY